MPPIESTASLRARAIIAYASARCDNDLAKTTSCLLRCVRDLVLDGSDQLARRGDVPNARQHAAETMRGLARLLTEEARDIEVDG